MIFYGCTANRNNIRRSPERDGIIYLDDYDKKNSDNRVASQSRKHIERGKASYYGDKFHGRKIASGEIFDQNNLTAAHPTHKFNTVVKVTNLVNHKSVIVRINDRGPYAKNRIIDLSKAAAKKIDMISAGVVEVSVEVIRKP